MRHYVDKGKGIVSCEKPCFCLLLHFIIVQNTISRSYYEQLWINYQQNNNKISTWCARDIQQS